MNQPAVPTAAPEQDENKLIAERREKLKHLRQAQADTGAIAFPNDFKPKDRAAGLHQSHDATEKVTLDADIAAGKTIAASVAGRMMLKRVMGKASFATLQDATGRIQIYVARDDVGEADYDAFKHWDLGDIVAAEGHLFKTKTGELSIHATRIRLLTKSLRPLPDKFHGMQDQELKYRQRYVDLIMDEAARARFAARSQTLAADRPGHGPKVTLQQAVAWQDEELGVLEDIPPLPTCHVARTGADEQIERWLHRERRAVITGLPGMGKSTLAAAFAHRYAQRHPVFWLTFGADRNQTAEEVLRQLALFGLANGAHNTQSPVLRRIAVGAAPGPPRQQLASITAALHALGPALLVFDDAQYAAHHADIMTIFRSLSTGAPYCRLLFIARETFDLADAPHLTLGGLARQEALALLDALETPGATPRLLRHEIMAPLGLPVEPEV